MRIADCRVQIPGGSGTIAKRWSLRSIPQSVLLTAITVALGPLQATDSPPSHRTETLRGRVVYLAAAFEKQTGIATVPEARDRVLALQTADGHLVPLFEDVRARAFRRDERLRDMQLELTVRRYETSPAVQIIRVVEVAKEGRYEIDYWCEICAIPMFEKKDCECCQGDVVLRRRKVTD